MLTAPGSPEAPGFFCLYTNQEICMKRAVFFIDGFNFYHSIANEKSFHRFKWIDYSSLASKFIKANETITQVILFTAYATWNEDKVARHKLYVKILKYHGIEVILGRFQKKDCICRAKCKLPYTSHEEKLTDVNIAVELLKSCVKDDFDVAYLISGDNDLVPALKAVKEICPTKKLNVILPINSKAKSMIKTCNNNGFGYSRIKKKHLESSQLPERITIEGQLYTRPPSWK